MKSIKHDADTLGAHKNKHVVLVHSVAYLLLVAAITKVRRAPAMPRCGRATKATLEKNELFLVQLASSTRAWMG